MSTLAPLLVQNMMGSSRSTRHHRPSHTGKHAHFLSHSCLKKRIGGRANIKGHPSIRWHPLYHAAIRWHVGAHDAVAIRMLPSVDVPMLMAAMPLARPRPTASARRPRDLKPTDPVAGLLFLGPAAPETLTAPGEVVAAASATNPVVPRPRRRRQRSERVQRRASRASCGARAVAREVAAPAVEAQ